MPFLLILGGRKRLKNDDFQIRASVEVALVFSADRGAKFESARADHKIDQRQIDSFSRLFSTDTRNDFGCVASVIGCTGI